MYIILYVVANISIFIEYHRKAKKQNTVSPRLFPLGYIYQALEQTISTKKPGKEEGKTENAIVVHDR